MLIGAISFLKVGLRCHIITGCRETRTFGSRRSDVTRVMYAWAVACVDARVWCLCACFWTRVGM